MRVPHSAATCQTHQFPNSSQGRRDSRVPRRRSPTISLTTATISSPRCHACGGRAPAARCPRTCRGARRAGDRPSLFRMVCAAIFSRRGSERLTGHMRNTWVMAKARCLQHLRLRWLSTSEAPNAANWRRAQAVISPRRPFVLTGQARSPRCSYLSRLRAAQPPADPARRWHAPVAAGWRANAAEFDEALGRTLGWPLVCALRATMPGRRAAR